MSFHSWCLWREDVSLRRFEALEQAILRRRFVLEAEARRARFWAGLEVCVP